MYGLGKGINVKKGPAPKDTMLGDCTILEEPEVDDYFLLSHRSI